MKITLYKVRLKTAGKTPEQIMADYEEGFGQVPSEEEVQCWINAYDLISDIEIVVMKSLTGDRYIPVSWDEADDDKIRDFFYQSEQDPFFGTYINEREEFINDWDSEEYSPAGSLSFDSGDIEIIEELNKQ